MKFKIASSVVCKVLENLSSIDSFNPDVLLSFILNILPSKTVPRDIRTQKRKVKSSGRPRSNVWSRPVPLNEVLQNFHLFLEKFHSSPNLLPGIIRYLIFTFLRIFSMTYSILKLKTKSLEHLITPLNGNA